MTIIRTPDPIRSVRDALSAVLEGRTPDVDQGRVLRHLITDLDSMRPLNSTGQHVAHTNLCGCSPVREPR